MKSSIAAVLVALGASRVAAHATFQALWVNGVDYISLPHPKSVVAAFLTDKPSTVPSVLVCPRLTRPFKMSGPPT
jgi:hypothetical protein